MRMPSFSRVIGRALCLGLWLSSPVVFGQDNKPVIVITPQEVCDYCDTLVDATFDLTGTRLYLAARGKDQEGYFYPYLSLWDVTRTNHTQAVQVIKAKSPVQDSGDFMIKLDPSGQLMGVAGHTMKLWRAKMNNGTLPYLATLTKGTSQIHSFAFSHKGDKIAYSLDSDDLTIWDTFNNKTLIAKTNGNAVSIQFHLTKLFVLDGLGGSDTEIWDYSQTTSGAPKHLAWFHAPGGAYVVTFDPSGERVGVSMGRCHCAALWSMDSVISGSTAPLARMQHDDVVYFISFDATGRYIVTTSSDYTAKLWDSMQIKDEVPLLLATMKHECSVYLGLFAQDKSRILTSSDCGEVKLWDTLHIKEGGDATLLNTFNTDSSYRKIELDPAGIWLLTVNSKAAELWDIAAIQPDLEPADPVDED